MPMSKLMRSKTVLWLTLTLTLMFAFSATLGLFRLMRKQAQHASAPARTANVNAEAAGSFHDESTPIVPVYLLAERRVDKVPLETYVRGVVAAEMPIEFELEALKAQALAARTYIVRRVSEGDFSQMPVKDAWVTDTVAHQAYLTEVKLKEKWSGDEYRRNMEKLNRAVQETKDKILLYQGKPISATFFSTSNGYTENAEDYWGQYIPYLRSVPSPWDARLSPHYKETVVMPYRQFMSKLGLTGTVTASAAVSGTRVLEHTAGQRIKKVRIGGKLFTGREVRERLNLNSSQFEWKMNGADVEITTTGYGHGVGMSQWGANGMAQEGKTAEDIVKYYYTGIEIGRKSDAIKQ